jgi:hypothetical protein
MAVSTGLAVGIARRHNNVVGTGNFSYLKKKRIFEKI